MDILSHGCTLDCFDACKFNVYVEDGKVLKIEGDKNHPYTKGFICKKGRAHLDRLNHKDRIYKPLLKINDVWQEISFEKAIEIISDKLKYYKKQFGTQSIIYYEQYGSGSILKSIGEIFFNFYGGVSIPKGGPCWSAGIKAQKYDFGSVKSHCIEDMLNSKNIFVWGKNPAYTTIHTMQMINKARKNGSKLIVIDPIFTDTAKVADKYIRINPGSDGALALAMIKIIFDQNLQDIDFINDYVVGYEEFKTYTDTLNLEYLIDECGVADSEIRDLVKIYTDKYSTIYIGYGMQKYKNGGNTIRLIDALCAITGQIGVSGGGVNYANMVYPNVLNLDPYKSGKYANNREFYVSHISEFISESLNKSKDEIPVKMAIITKSNLLNQLAGLNELEKSMSNIEFKVCFDMFMTDTAKACDLFIPCTNTLESEDIVFSSMTNPYIIYNEKVVEPKNKLMDEYYFFRKLANEMGLKAYPKVSKVAYLSKVVEPLKQCILNIDLEKIKKEYITIHKKVAWKDKKFETLSGKFELYSKLAKDDGLSAIPKCISYKRENKFRLLTNHARDSIASQHIMDKKCISQAFINEKMVTKLSIQNKEIVHLKSKKNSIRVEINIDDNVGDYIVKMYAGWWKENGNPNFIIESGISDMGGQVTYNETFVDIIKQN